MAITLRPRSLWQPQRRGGVDPDRRTSTTTTTSSTPASRYLSRTRARRAVAAASLLAAAAAPLMLGGGATTELRSIALGVGEYMHRAKERTVGGGRRQQRPRRSFRRLQDSWCYGNMLTNGDFTADVTTDGSWVPEDTIQLANVDSSYADGPDGQGNALRLYGRKRYHEGATQNLGHALQCFAANPDGSPFYVRIQATIRLEFPLTGKGTTLCKHDDMTASEDRTLKDSRQMKGGLSALHCPFMWLRARMAEPGEDTYDTYHKNEEDVNVDVHDPNVGHPEWNADGWNAFDVIMRIPPTLESDTNGLVDMYLGLAGGTRGTDLLIDNVVLSRVEESDLPHGEAVFDPHDGIYSQKFDEQIKSCENNFFLNGDGEYGSPWGWDNFWGWNAKAKIDVVEPGYGGEGWAVAVIDREGIYVSGISQYARGQDCFWDYGYYVRIEGQLKLYDQETGAPITGCSSDYINTMVKCPHLKIVYTGGPQLDPNANAGNSRSYIQYFDYNLMDNYVPGEWNKLSIIVAFSPGYEEFSYSGLEFAFIGGEGGSVLALDQAQAFKIKYDDIPTGHDIHSIDGASKNRPTKRCHSTGDPHIQTFSSQQFDNMTAGWKTLYVKGDLAIETEQHSLEGRDPPIAINSAVRLTYGGTVYELRDGIPPPIEDGVSMPREAEHKFVFLDPEVNVFLKYGEYVDGRYTTSLNIWIVTKEGIACDGLCCDLEGDGNLTKADDFPSASPPRAEAEHICGYLEQTDAYEDCIYDYRAIATPPADLIDDANATEAYRLEALTFLRTNTIPAGDMDRVLQIEALEQNYAELTTGASMQDSGVENDPVIVGFRNQIFKFDGRSDAWYANLAAESVQWNMKFHTFEDCPGGRDTYVTGFSYMLREARAIAHSVVVRVRDEGTFLPGCGDGHENDGSAGPAKQAAAAAPPQEGQQQEPQEPPPPVCLGDGSLEIMIDGKIIVHAGDYSTDDGQLRVVAHNTFGECARHWQDMDADFDGAASRPEGAEESNTAPVNSKRDKEREFVSEGWTKRHVLGEHLWNQKRQQPDLATLPRRLEGDSVKIERDQHSEGGDHGPLKYVLGAKGHMIDPQECDQWLRERKAYGDLFQQAGGWSSVHIESPHASFQVEYRQNIPEESEEKTNSKSTPPNCASHSIDAWMSKVSPELRAQKWRGVLGETRDGQKGSTDRKSILVGQDDSDYEVSGPYGTNFNALRMDSGAWTWPWTDGDSDSPKTQRATRKQWQ